MGRVHTRSASRFDFSPNARHLFDLRVKPLVAQGLALLDSEPDIVNRRAVEMGAEQRTIGRLSLVIVPSERPIERMRRQSSVRLPESVRHRRTAV